MDNIEEQMEKAIPVFIKAAYDKRLSEIFPDLTSEGKTEIMKAIDTTMEIGPHTPEAEAISVFEAFSKTLQDNGITPDQDTLTKLHLMVENVDIALVGMGTMILEEGAVDRIIWFDESVDEEAHTEALLENFMSGGGEVFGEIKGEDGLWRDLNGNVTAMDENDDPSASRQ